MLSITDHLDIMILSFEPKMKSYNAIGELIHYSEGKDALFEELSVSAYKTGMYLATTLTGDIPLKENVLIK